jgi:signal transduction histidine kinase
MFRNKLGFKLIFFITIVLIFTIGFFAFINIKIQKKFLMGEMKQNAIRLSQTIKKSIEYEMLTAQSDHVQRSLEDIGKLEGMEHIRIYDKKGKIIAADTPGDVGLIIDLQAEACYSCHIGKEPLKNLPPPDMTRTFQSDNGQRALGVINPIYNEPQCFNSACHFHPEDQNVLGVLDVSISLSQFDEQIGSNRKQFLTYLVLTFLLISIGISLFVFLFVNTPIHKLIEGTRRIAEGDLNYRIGSYYSDEIGELGRSFDKMTVEMKKSQEKVEKWNLHLENEVKKATEELKKSNEQLNNANLKLRELDDLKSDFMRRMEHGSRSHIAVIKSCLSLVRGEYYSELNEQLKDLIQTAERRSDTLLALLDDILILSFRKSTREVYKKEPVNLEDILKKAFDDVRVRAQKKNIRIDIQLPQDLPQLSADSEALFEAFSNLLHNAVKYTKDQGSVHVSAQQNKESLEIDVVDTGIGISADDLPWIFDEFYRASNAKSHKIEGTGVGLAIVKEIIEAHNGVLKVQSEPGKGSTFTVILPIS